MNCSSIVLPNQQNFKKNERVPAEGGGGEETGAATLRAGARAPAAVFCADPSGER